MGGCGGGWEFRPQDQEQVRRMAQVSNLQDAGGKLDLPLTIRAYSFVMGGVRERRKIPMERSWTKNAQLQF